VPVWSIAYFSVTHWLLHRGPAYTHVHSWHHKNVNVGPWSGLAMHPLEHVVLYADVLLFLVLPAHPVHFLFAMMHHSLGAPMSHTGHDALRLPGGFRFELGDFFHQLHHRFIECNYGGPESPLDTAINAWHDGTEEGEQATAARRRRLSAAKRAR
jgi:sterol desaturase/sphingolipid hydroxylase (fatty acid hydroxylase superfamily)